MQKIELKDSKFPIGRLVLTSGVFDKAEEDEEFRLFVNRSLNRHVAGDWGEACTEDKQANDLALKDGSRLFSAYDDLKHPKIWIITEWDRSATTVLFPSEY